MKFLMVGISHKTSTIEIREKFFLRSTEKELLLSEMKSDPRVIDAVILSTCNRTEIYAHLLEDNPDLLLSFLFKIKNISFLENLKEYFFTYSETEAVEHLLRVSCGLQSLILGEKQILGQVKAAVELSREKTMLSKNMNILTNLAIKAGKKAQHETTISKGGSSVSWAAVSMAEKLCTTLKDKNVLIVGAGKMSQLTAGQLAKKHVGQVYVMNRTHEKAEELAAQIGAKAISFWNMKETLKDIDVCICSVGAPHYVIEKDLIEQTMADRKNRPMMLIDISTPRNIDPQTAEIDNVRLVSIDELDQVVEKTLQKRSLAIKDVEVIVENKISEYYAKLEKIQHYQMSVV